MNIRAIAFDLDGTVLENGVVPSHLFNRLRRFAEAGGILIPATGRTLDAILSILEQSGFLAAVGYSQFMVPGQKWVFERDRSGYTPLGDYNEIYLKKWTANLKKVREYLSRCEEELSAVGITHDIWQRFEEDQSTTGHIDVCFPRNGDEEQGESILISGFRPVLDIQVTGNGNLRIIMLAGYGKGEALAYIAKTAGIPSDRILAIGDDLNDTSMLDGRFGFLSATLANAHPRILRAVKSINGFIARGAGSAGFAEVMDWIQSNGKL